MKRCPNHKLWEIPAQLNRNPTGQKLFKLVKEKLTSEKFKVKDPDKLSPLRNQGLPQEILLKPIVKDLVQQISTSLEEIDVK